MVDEDPADEYNLRYLVYWLGFGLVLYIVGRIIAGVILTGNSTGAYVSWWENPSVLLPIILVFAVLVLGFQSLMARLTTDDDGMDRL